MKHSKLRGCGICLLFLAILIPLNLKNVKLFLLTTDIIWGILNYLDDSEFEYQGYIYLHHHLYAPVDEERVDYNLKVIHGKIPSECDGVLFKIGANPINKNIAIKHHWFDGDGMVHAIKLNSNNNTAHYSNKLMNTTKYHVERDVFKRSVYGNKIGPFHANGMIGLFKGLFGVFIEQNEYSPLNTNLFTDTDYIHDYTERGTANTAVLKWNNKLFALHEGSKPFEFNYNPTDCTMSSIGYYNFSNSWKYPFTAHPKIDLEDRLFTHGNYIQPDFELVVGMADTKNENVLINSHHIKLNSPQMMHDMLITNKYILIFDLNMYLGDVLFTKTNYSRTMAMSTEKNGRIGVMVKEQLLKQKKKAKIKWFDIKPCVVFHFINSFETENDDIVITGDRYNYLDLMQFQLTTNKLNESLATINYPKLYEWKLSMKTGKLIEEGALTINLDKKYHHAFSQINPLYRTKKNKYFWASRVYDDAHGVTMYDGIVKYDTEKQKIVNQIVFKKNDFGNSEITIIAKKQNGDNNNKEDDVYILSIVYNQKDKKSRLEIYDGATMDKETVATIQLNSRIPIGFHNLFVTQNDLNKMI